MKTKLAIFSEKIIEAGWLAAVVAVPLFFNIYTARTFEPDKITLLRSLAMVMILAWLIVLLEQGRSSGPPLAERWRDWLKAPLFLPTALLVISYIISTIFSLSPKVSIWGSYQRLQGTYSAFSYMVIFAMMALNLRSRAQLERLVTVVIVTSVPVSLYGVVQRYGLDPLPWAGDVTTRVASTLGNAIFVSSYLIMVMPLVIVRLVQSMTAIVKDEAASWGHTVLAAVYIFILVIQTLTIVFSQSRGPMIGVLAAVFVMGLMLLLLLRQRAAEKTTLSLKELASGLLFLAPLALASGLGGGVGFGLGWVLESVLFSLSYDLDLSLIGGLLGTLLGFVGGYTTVAATDRGWRWLWVSWLGVAAVGLIFVLALNLRQTGLDPLLDSVRDIPGINRLSQLTSTESGTGRVRVLIWDAALNLVIPHQPLGIGDEVVPKDRFNGIRPLIGYGPESMFNAFAFVYPPDLAHVEARGSSADRSHNETVDSLVITGLFGFLVFYFLMVSLFYQGLTWLGWAPNPAAKRRLVATLVIFAGLGALAAYLADVYLADGGLTFVPLGLPVGLVLGVLAHLVWQGVAGQVEAGGPIELGLALLLIGLLGGFIGHFIEVHFVFSIAATYTYFWAYAGLLVALAKVMSLEQSAAATQSAEPNGEEESTEPTFLERDSESSRTRRGRGRRKSRRKTVGVGQGPSGEGWEAWVGSQGLAMAIIMIIITFNFVTPQFRFQLGDEDSMSLLWLIVITWLIGFAITISEIAVKRDQLENPVSWGRATALYAIFSISYSFFYYLAHTIQFGQRITVNVPSDVIKAADVLANGLVIFYIFLLLLMVLFAFTLSWGQLRRLSLWRAENWWLYPPLVAALFTVIWFKNINVARADIYLKEGDRYRSGQQWEQAIALHDKARSIDDDEDFYYLMLALDYQLMAQDTRLEEATRQQAWSRGEETALEARRINPYNPDNTGNMGRYYFTVGQVVDQSRFADALEFFERATVLAPSNVIYHNLWAQTYYILRDYDKTIARLKISLEIDPKYPPTWALLGDTYAAQGNVEEALKAHKEAMQLQVRGSDGFAVFADQFLDQRLNFYVSAGKVDDIVAAMQAVAQARPDTGPIQAAIARAYIVAGRQAEAIPFLEEAINLGNGSPQLLKELGSIYLTNNNYEQALPLYQFVSQNNPADVEAHSALAFIYAQQGRTDEAIEQNQLVLQQLPSDYDSLKNLAILYQQKGQLREALSMAQQAKVVAPEADKPSWDPFIADLEDQLAASDAG
jgi:tetratricopeptide (TPR) repeat protein